MIALQLHITITFKSDGQSDISSTGALLHI